jgi:hypothetical protein
MTLKSGIQLKILSTKSPQRIKKEVRKDEMSLSLVTVSSTFPRHRRYRLENKRRNEEREEIEETEEEGMSRSNYMMI